MADSKILLAFRQIEILKTLSSQTQESIASFCMIRSVRKGETLFCENEPSPYAFGVLSAEITLSYANPKVAPTLFGVGSLLGAAALLQDMPRPGRAVVSIDGELLSIWASRLRGWLSANGAKGSTIKEELQQRLK